MKFKDFIPVCANRLLAMRERRGASFAGSVLWWLCIKEFPEAACLHRFVDEWSEILSKHQLDYKYYADSILLARDAAACAGVPEFVIKRGLGKNAYKPDSKE